MPTINGGSGSNGHVTPNFHVLIVGSGIAGLSAAVSCKEKGFDVTILEAAEEFDHVSCLTACIKKILPY
jgi:2-polyprenyl-6-methoxyphenol hydroxylase-like FAD-dependent oxidoreductase